MGKLIIDGNSVYEVDEECIRKKEREKREKSGRQEEKKERKERFNITR